MGACGSSMTEEQKIARAKAKEIDARQAKDCQVDTEMIKLLLLGAGESGKSTIFKQMRQLYGKGFDEASRKQVNAVICNNLYTGTRTVLENCDRLNHTIVEPAAVEAKAVVEGDTDHHKISPELAKAIETLWEDPQFQETYQDRSEYQLFDCYADFAKQIKNYPEWGGEDWIPKISDVMKARVRTSGIVEEEYVIESVTFKMYDVGGQRNERKKWIHCFDGVTAVIFVGAISEYDQVLYEDKTQNRLQEAVDLFDEICNSKWFSDTSMILFLNKRDLFEIKYLEKKVPMEITGLPFFVGAPKIEDYETGKEAYDAACEWAIGKFMDVRNDATKEIYHHITCATDTNNISTVFNACREIILKQNLKGSGFMT